MAYFGGIMFNNIRFNLNYFNIMKVLHERTEKSIVIHSGVIDFLSDTDDTVLKCSMVLDYAQSTVDNLNVIYNAIVKYAPLVQDIVYHWEPPIVVDMTNEGVETHRWEPSIGLDNHQDEVHYMATPEFDFVAGVWAQEYDAKYALVHPLFNIDVASIRGTVGNFKVIVPILLGDHTVDNSLYSVVTPKFNHIAGYMSTQDVTIKNTLLLAYPVVQNILRKIKNDINYGWNQFKEPLERRAYFVMGISQTFGHQTRADPSTELLHEMTYTHADSNNAVAFELLMDRAFTEYTGDENKFRNILEVLPTPRGMVNPRGLNRRIFPVIATSWSYPTGLAKKILLFTYNLLYTFQAVDGYYGNLAKVIPMISTGMATTTFKIATVKPLMANEFSALTNEGVTIVEMPLSAHLISNDVLTVIRDEFFTERGVHWPTSSIVSVNRIYNVRNRDQINKQGQAWVGDHWLYFYEFNDDIWMSSGDSTETIPRDQDDDGEDEEPIDLVDIKYWLLFEDEITLVDEITDKPTYADSIMVTDSFKVKHIPYTRPIFDISGQQWWLGSENAVDDFTVHLFRVSSDDIRDTCGNLPDYTTRVSESNGFMISGVPAGEYVVIAMKPHYTVGWKKVTVVDGNIDIDMVMLKLPKNAVIERPYNRFGHIYKMYQYRNEVVGDRRYIEGMIVFGDLYGTSESVWNIEENGYLRIQDSDQNGRLYLVSMRDLGTNGFLETPTESITVSSDRKTISWKSLGRMGDFSGFCYRYVTEKNKSGALEFSFGEPLSIIETGDTDYSIFDKLTRYSASHSAPTELPTWNPTFNVELVDGICMSDVDMLCDVERDGRTYRSVLLEDVFALDEDIMTPPKLHVTGVTVDNNANRVDGIVVAVVNRMTGVIADWVVSDEYGRWTVGNLDSEMQYDVYASDPAGRYRSVRGSFLAGSRDIIERRVTSIYESDTYRGEYGELYFDILEILPALDAVGGDEVRIYGRIYDKDTGDGLNYALVEVYEGQYDLLDLDTYNGVVRSSFSSSNAAGNGYYEVWLPKGQYSLRVKKDGYKPSDLYYPNIQSGYALSIPLRKAVLSGGIYDALAYSAGVLKPLEGAIVTILGTDRYVTDATGQYYINAPSAASLAGLVMYIECPGYQTMQKQLPTKISGNITGYTIKMMKTNAYLNSSGM